MVTSWVEWIDSIILVSEKSNHTSVFRWIWQLLHVHKVRVRLLELVVCVGTVLHRILEKDLELNILIYQYVHDIIDEIMLDDIRLLLENIIKQVLSRHFQNRFIFHLLLILLVVRFVITYYRLILHEWVPGIIPVLGNCQAIGAEGPFVKAVFLEFYELFKGLIIVKASGQCVRVESINWDASWRSVKAKTLEMVVMLLQVAMAVNEILDDWSVFIFSVWVKLCDELGDLIWLVQEVVGYALSI